MRPEEKSLRKARLSLRLIVMQELVVVGILLVFVSAALAALGFRGREQIVGIDLGTTYSVVAVKSKGKVTVLPNHETGKLLTPSVVSFMSGGGALVGEAAVARRALAPERTIYNAKRFIGRSMMEVRQTENASFLADQTGMTIREQLGNSSEIAPAGFLVPPGTGGGEHRWVSPIEVGAEVVAKLKASITAFMGYEMHRAVICVPAKFSAKQAEATRKAFERGGFKVMRIMEEPTAAAVAYNLHKLDSDSKVKVRHVLVYDIGGGTLDTSLLFTNGRTVNVMDVAGDDHLGGADFDQRMLHLLDAKLAASKPEPEGSPRRRPRRSPGARDGEELPSCARESLSVLAEQAKCDLSNTTKVVVRCRQGGLGKAGSVRAFPVTREEFEQASQELFERAMAPVKKVLKGAMMEPSMVDDVVLVGGASRMPKLRSLLREFFGDGKRLHMEIDPDVTVAYGAANIID